MIIIDYICDLHKLNIFVLLYFLFFIYIYLNISYHNSPIPVSNLVRVLKDSDGAATRHGTGRERHPKSPGLNLQISCSSFFSLFRIVGFGTKLVTRVQILRGVFSLRALFDRRALKLITIVTDECAEKERRTCAFPTYKWTFLSPVHLSAQVTKKNVHL